MQTASWIWYLELDSPAKSDPVAVPPEGHLGCNYAESAVKMQAGKPLAMSSCCETLGYRNDSILLSKLAGRGKPLECWTGDAFGNAGRETGLDADKISAT